jgi:hypothetical protein
MGIRSVAKGGGEVYSSICGSAKRARRQHGEVGTRGLKSVAASNPLKPGGRTDTNKLPKRRNLLKNNHDACAMGTTFSGRLAGINVPIASGLVGLDQLAIMAEDQLLARVAKLKCQFRSVIERRKMVAGK